MLKLIYSEWVQQQTIVDSAWTKSKWSFWQSFVFLLNKSNHTGEQKVSSLCVDCCPRESCFIHFILYFSNIYSSHCIFLPLFHLISSRTNTNRSHLESSPHSVVPHFVCLHFISRSGKATVRTRLQSESSCCCLRHCTTSDCVCEDIYRSYTHIQFVGLTPTPAHAHTWHTSTHSALPLLLRRSFIVSCHLFVFHVDICFLCCVWADCRLQNLLFNENVSFLL